LLRYSDNLRSVDTYSEHKRIEEQFGDVWWGKFGVGASADIVALAKTQVKAGVPSYVYLVNNRAIRYRGELVDILGGGGVGRYRPRDSNRIPSYYRDEELSIWFKLKGLREATKLDKAGLTLFNAKSLRPELNGMKGLVYVCRTRSRAES
jgi:hypothetical protein